MEEIVKKEFCTGCKLCENICPVNAIHFEDDDCGFWYPIIDQNKCTSCGLCRVKCPSMMDGYVLRADSFDTPCVYSAWSRDHNIRKTSTSGGVFWEIASEFINGNGVVVGSAYSSDWKGAEHIIATNMEELVRLRGSKYFQSDTHKIYGLIKSNIELHKKVLFCGVPCQNAALRSYLGDSIDSVYFLDFICRSINSPLAFKKYIEEIEGALGGSVTYVRLKDKENGWQNLSSRVILDNGKKSLLDRYNDPWVQGFIEEDLYTRRACFNCRYRKLPRISSDITIGDFWGIQGENHYDCFQGISAVIINTPQGKQIFERCKRKLFIKAKSMSELLNGNPSLISSPKENIKVEKFFNDLKVMPFSAAVLNNSIRLSRKTKTSILKGLKPEIDEMRKRGNVDIAMFIYLNYFCKKVIRHGAARIIPGTNIVMDMQKDSEIHVYGNLDLEIGYGKLRKSKAETFLRMGCNSKIIFKHGGLIFYQCTVEVKDNATLTAGYFSMNTGSVFVIDRKLVLGEDIMMGRNVMVYDSDFHQIVDSKNREINLPSPVVIEDHVWLTSNIIVHKGVTIGHDSIVYGQNRIEGNILPYSVMKNSLDIISGTGTMRWKRDGSRKYLSIIGNYEIVLYGYGIVGKQIYQQYGKYISTIIDNNSKQNGVVTFKDYVSASLHKNMENVAFLIASPNFYNEIYYDIKKAYNDVLIVSAAEFL